MVVTEPTNPGLRAASVAGLEIHLFGEFQVLRGEDLVEREEWGRQKSRPLLKLLLTRPGRAFSRDEILEALWSDVSPEAGERSLRATVSMLRKALEPGLERGSDSRYVLRRSPGYSFDGRAECWVDAWEFEERQHKAEVAWEAGRLGDAIERYRETLDLVRGEFLAEDPYEEWAIEARQEWHERHLSILSSLAECLALRGKYTQAVEVCNRALVLDCYREDLHRRLMLYHYCAGEQALALRAYRDYADTLKEGLGTAPSLELTRLKERIENRDVPGVDEMRRYPRPRRPLRFPYSLGRTHFVGREREYAWLAERLGEAAEGSGGTVAVEGEAGVGKTRLVEEFLGYARSRGALVLSGRCYERELGPPLEPVTDALGPLAAEERAAPDILEEDFGYGRKLETDGDARVYGSLFQELIRRSRDAEEALIFFVDDVQWADPATLEFLSYAAKHVPGRRVLIIFAYRREDVARLSGWLDHLAERRAVATLSLDRLLEEDTAELVGRMASRGFERLPALADFLYRESEGNPFYAVEYLRWLIESGIVRVDSRRRISALEGELQDDALPSGVRALIQARISGLGDEARDLLELAAVIGRTFDLPLLREVTAHGEAGTLGVMDLLLDSGLVVKSSRGTYHFSHDKLRQTLYEGIGDFERQEMHLRVAEALNEMSGEPAELAHHYLRAGAWGPALENLVLAARKAQEGYAWETALDSYARALEIVGELPDSGERRFELLAARERLLEYAGRREERVATVQEMFELASVLGERKKIAEVHIRRIGVLADVEDAVKTGWDAVAIFRELGDRAGEAQAHREISYVLWINRDYTGALEANFRALWIHRELEDRRGEAGIVGNIAQVYRNLGDHEQALWWSEEAARIYRELGDRLGEAMKINTIAAVHRDRGDLATALSLSLKTLRYDAEVGAKDLLVQQHGACGTLYLRLGDPKEALEHFHSAASLGREMGYTREEGYSLMSAGVCLEQLGEHAGAADAYRKAVSLLHTAYEASGMAKELSGRADALALLASVLHRSLDEPTEALEVYEAAAGVYRELGDAHRLRKVLLGLAGLRWRARNPEGAAGGYEEALELAREHSEAAHEVVAVMSLGVVYRDLGRFRESVRCGRAALELLRGLEDPWAKAYVLSSLAESHRKLEHHPSALSCLKRSLRLRKKIGDEEGMIGVLQDLARVYESLGDPERARACAREAKEGAPEGVLSSERRG